MPRPISWLDWLRFGPFLAQLIVTRGCNLACSYCSERAEAAGTGHVPFESLRLRLDKLRRLRTWAVSLMGGEPTLHPDLLRLFEEMRRLGFRRRMMTTNGLLLDAGLIEGLNRCGATDVCLSVDGARRSPVSDKTLELLGATVDLLARRARFKVTLNAVVGCTSRAELLEVLSYARSRAVESRVLLLHDERGQLGVPPERREAYAPVLEWLGRGAREAHGYRGLLLSRGSAPFHCRAGSRYLYVDEHGVVRWCAQTRGLFGKDLLTYTPEDLRWQFEASKPCSPGCCLGCARTASAYDEWRGQGETRDVPEI